MAAKTYDPSEISVIVGGAIISGFADGTFVSIDRSEDAYTYVGGADGLGTRVKNANRDGTITITLQQSSDSNDFLSGLAAADEINNGGVVPVLVQDNSGRSVYAAETAWVQKIPTSGYGKEADTREWVLRTDNLTMFVAGN